MQQKVLQMDTRWQTTDIVNISQQIDEPTEKTEVRKYRESKYCKGISSQEMTNNPTYK